MGCVQALGVYAFQAPSDRRSGMRLRRRLLTTRRGDRVDAAFTNYRRCFQPLTLAT